MKIDHEARFWSKVEPTGFCWEWTGGKIPSGYGMFWFEGRNHGAHRVAYQILVAPIPDGLQMDHLCRNKGCVNPDHLEPVTAQENSARRPRGRTHCPKGHAYTPENTRMGRAGGRNCRACHRAAQARIRARKVAA